MQADLVFTGGTSYTPDQSRRRLVPVTMAPGGPPASAVAVQAGRIIATCGDAADRSIADLIGPKTEVVQLGGGALLPGFQDAHVHPAFAGVTMIGCNLIGAATRCRGAGPDQRLCRRSPRPRVDSGQWLADGMVRPRDAWPGTARPGNRRPARLPGQSRRARRLGQHARPRAGGHRRAHADPPDGRIERSGDGTPQGTLHEGAANLVGRLVPDLTVAERLAGLLLAQRHLHARGITAWQDAIVGHYLGSPDPLPVYLAAADSGQLTARVRGALWWDRERGSEQLPEILGRREQGQAGQVPG